MMQIDGLGGRETIRREPSCYSKTNASLVATLLGVGSEACKEKAVALRVEAVPVFFVVTKRNGTSRVPVRRILPLAS